VIELNKEQQIKLLKLARKTINEYLVNNSINGIDSTEFLDDIFNEKCGAFVTIHIKGKLRGCIGYIKGIKIMPETIKDMAKASAFQDPRFSPLTKEEFKNIDIEISIMSPIEVVKGVSDIVIGRDGLIISSGGRSGLLLPQVATEQKWDLQHFLENICYKAGLPGDAWKRSDTILEKFSAQVFGEKDLGLI